MVKDRLHSLLGPEIKSCGFCKHLKPVISWWCGNEEAINAHNTAIPMPFFDCEFFELGETQKPFEFVDGQIRYTEKCKSF